MMHSRIFFVFWIKCRPMETFVSSLTQGEMIFSTSWRCQTASLVATAHEFNWVGEQRRIITPNFSNSSPPPSNPCKLLKEMLRRRDPLQTVVIKGSLYERSPRICLSQFIISLSTQNLHIKRPYLHNLRNMVNYKTCLNLQYTFKILFYSQNKWHNLDRSHFPCIAKCGRNESLSQWGLK